MISCPGILKPKGHHLIAERPPQGDEGSLFRILWCRFYLIVTGEPIHEGKQSEIGRIVHEDIDVQQRKIVLGTGSIQVPIIYAHSYLPILLGDWYNVGKPFWVPSDNQNTSVKLFLYLFLYFQGRLGLHPPQLLFYRGTLRI